VSICYLDLTQNLRVIHGSTFKDLTLMLTDEKIKKRVNTQVDRLSSEIIISEAVGMKMPF